MKSNESEQIKFENHLMNLYMPVFNLSDPSNYIIYHIIQNNMGTNSSNLTPLQINHHQSFQSIVKNALRHRSQSIIIKSNSTPSKISRKPLLYDKLIPTYSFQPSQSNQINVPTKLWNKLMQQYSEKNAVNELTQKCIGLILGTIEQNRTKTKIFGTGILIYNNIVLTNAQNVYCKRLKKQYMNIKFIGALKNQKHNGIYDIRRTYYPNQYTQQQKYQQHNYALLELEYDLSDHYGYIGLKINHSIQSDQTIYLCAYTENRGQFKLDTFQIKPQISNNIICYQETYKTISSGLIMIKDMNSDYQLIGLHPHIYLSNQIKDNLNSWTIEHQLDLRSQPIQQQIQLKQELCLYLKQYQINRLIKVNLSGNAFSDKGCRHLKDASWPNLKTINLQQNNIGQVGCKYLKEAYWPLLQSIDLQYNCIGYRGCKFIKDANWPHLKIARLVIKDVNIQKLLIGLIYQSQIYPRIILEIKVVSIQRIRLGLNQQIQIYFVIILVRQAVNILPKQIGLIQNILIYLQIALLMKDQNIQKTLIGCIQPQFTYKKT